MPVAIAPEVTSTTSRPPSPRARRCRRRAPRSGRRSGPVARRGDQAGADLHHEPADAGLAGGARPSRSSSRRAATPRNSSVSPRPVAAEIAWNGRPAAAQCRCDAARAPRRPRGRRPTRSALLATTICGRAASAGEYAASSASITCRSSSGSRPLAGSRSSTCSEQARALGVAQELVAEAAALAGAGDEAGQIGDDERAVAVDAHDAERGRQRGERVVADLGLGRRHARDQRRLAGVGKADHADVGEQLQLEMEPALGPGPAEVGAARRLVGRRREARVAAAAARAGAPPARAGPRVVRSPRGSPRVAVA